MLLPAANNTSRFIDRLTHKELQFCTSSSESGTSAALVCAGADVNVDAFLKERPGYKLVHLKACSGSTLDL